MLDDLFATPDHGVFCQCEACLMRLDDDRCDDLGCSCREPEAVAPQDDLAVA